MDLSLWFRNENDFILSKKILSENDPLITNDPSVSLVAYQICDVPDLIINPYTKNLFQQHNVYNDIDKNQKYLPTSNDIIDFCCLIKLMSKIRVIKAQFDTSLILSTVLNNPNLLKNADTSAIRFVDINTRHQKLEHPDYGYKDYNVYIPEFHHKLTHTPLKERHALLIENRNFRANQMQTFLESTLRSAMNDIKEAINELTKTSCLHKKLKNARILIFQAIIRNALVHNYIFKMEKYYLEQLPITWKGYKITQDLNNKEIYENHFPIADFNFLADDILKLIDKNIRQFPNLEINSPHIT